MKLYESEIQDGIKHINTTSLATQILPSKQEAQAEEYYKDVPDAPEYLKQSIPPDVMLVNCILVSNNWNKNDDVFTKEELAKSYQTPILKPANLNHRKSELDDKEPKIIGVITGSNLVDDNYRIIPPDNLPERVHILNSVFIWEQYFPKTAASIKASIENNKQYVSMECFFDDFGYALKDLSQDDGKIILLDRNELTAHLTKYLRIYKGKGEVTIEGKKFKIGRWIKNTIFSGIAFTEKPANDESIVFQDFVSHAETKDFAYAQTVPDLLILTNFVITDQHSVLNFDPNKVQLWP